MELDALGEILDSRGVSVTTGDLERDEGCLVEPFRGAQRRLHAPHLHHVDHAGAELDGSRQRLGFKLTLSPPPATPVEVRWELGRPGAGRRVADGQGRKARPRKVQLGRAHFRPGEAVLEQHVAFSPGDPTGLWNMRVVLGQRVLPIQVLGAFLVVGAIVYLTTGRAR